MDLRSPEHAEISRTFLARACASLCHGAVVCTTIVALSGCSESAEPDAKGGIELPEVSAESMPVGDVLHPGVGPESQQNATVAVGDGTALVVWADNRADLSPYGGTDILGVRYGADGSLLDSTPLWIGKSQDYDTEPAVAFGDGTFFVVWTSITRAPNGAGAASYARGTRVLPSGAVLDAEGIDLAEDASMPSIAFAEDRFVIALSAGASASGQFPLRVMTVSTSGEVIAAPSTIDVDGYYPSLGSDGSQVLLSYYSEPTVTTRSRHLLLLDSELQTKNDLSWPIFIGGQASVAGGPTGFLAAWSEEPSIVHVRRLDSNGEWLDDTPLMEELGYPSLCRDGAGYVVVDSSGARRFDDTASELGPLIPIPPSGTSLYYPKVACAGSSRFVAWSDVEATDIGVIRLDSASTPLDSTAQHVPHGNTSQIAPVVGRIGDDAVLAFQEASRDQNSVRVARLAPDGVHPDGTTYEIPDAAAPALASSASSTLLVWTVDDKSEIGGALIAPDGSLGAKLSIASGSTFDETFYVESPHVAATSGGFIVTHHYFGGDTLQSNVRAVSVSSDGVAGTSEVIGSGSDAIPIGLGEDVVFALRGELLYSSDLSVRCSSDPTPRALGSIAPGDLPALATDGQRVLVVWTDDASRRLEGAFVEASCDSMTPVFAISFPGRETSAPSASFDGERYLVAWRERGDRESDIHAARVLPDGSVVDTSGFVISDESGSELGVSIAPLGAWNLAAYARFDPSVDSVRILTRTLAGL